MKTFKQYFIEEVEGMGTYWRTEDGKITVTIWDVIKYLDSIGIPKDGVETNISDLVDNDGKSLLIGGIDIYKIGKRREKVDKTEHENLETGEKYPIIVVIDMNGRYKSVLDGNHRLAKAMINNDSTIRVRKLDLRTAPEEYEDLFNYEIEN